MSTPGELACIYACLALHDDGIPVTAENITSLLKAAKVEVESYWPGLFSKLVENRDINDLITSTGAGGGGGAPIAMSCAAAPAPVPVAEEKKKEEIVEDSDDDMSVIDIFGDE